MEPSGESHRGKMSILARPLFDFIFWTPRRCRYDPDNPPQFTLLMNMLMGLVGTK